MKTIDKKDQKIILELYRNGRAPITELASMVGISKEMTNYRLKRLQKEQILLKVIPIIDISLIGYKTNRLQILLNKEGKLKKIEIEKNLKNIKYLSKILKLSGQWDYALFFNTKQNTNFSDVYEKIINEFGNFIDEKLISQINSIIQLPPSHLIGGERKKITQKIKTQLYELEENQKRILKILNNDGRCSLIEIAKQLSVSISTIKYHLKILENKKIILGYRPLLNIEALGYEQIKVMIELTNRSEKNKLTELLIINKNIICITEALGKYDLEFECEYKQLNELIKFMSIIETEISIKKYDLIFTNQEILINTISD